MCVHWQHSLMHQKTQWLRHKQKGRSFNLHGTNYGFSQPTYMSTVQSTVYCVAEIQNKGETVDWDYFSKTRKFNTHDECMQTWESITQTGNISGNSVTGNSKKKVHGDPEILWRSFILFFEQKHIKIPLPQAVATIWPCYPSYRSSTKNLQKCFKNTLIWVVV